MRYVPLPLIGGVCPYLPSFHQMHNGCFPGTPSSFANMCHSKMVKPDVDLLFVEYVSNDFMIPTHINNFRVCRNDVLHQK